MSTRKPHSKAAEADAENGEVVVDGPGPTAVSLTPSAAAKSADRLARAAAKAEDQTKADASDSDDEDDGDTPDGSANTGKG